MNTEKQTPLLDELQRLLEKQVELAQRGNIRDVETLSKQASTIVEKIAKTEMLKSAEFKNRKDKLEKLYKDLCLTLTAKKAETAEELHRVHKGKKTIKTYRNNI